MNDLTEMQRATRRHVKLDALLAGTYGDSNGSWKGCSVSCLAHDLEPLWSADRISQEGHELIANAYDYPVWLARLQDAVFEGLPSNRRASWHVLLADAIAARKRDWETIEHAVQASILRISYVTAGVARQVVQRVIDLHEAAIAGGIVSSEDWSAARSARSARSAAWSAAESARSAAWSARSAAKSAAKSAFLTGK